MIARLGERLSRLARRVVPDPFVLVLLLTVLVFVLAAVHLAGRPDVGSAGSIARTLLAGWYAGFKSPAGLAFALQMCLILVTGHALAVSPPVQRLVVWVAGLPQSSAGAAALVAAVACVAAVLHWGLGAIVGALLAREVARDAATRGLKLHYPLLGAAAYSGLAVWHGGLSGSAPLKVAEANHFLEPVLGVLPVSLTLLSPLNLVVTGGLVLMLPALCWVLAPRDAALVVPPEPRALRPLPAAPRSEDSGAVAWLQDSPVVGRLCGLLGLTLLVGAAATGEVAFDLNAVILAFVCLALAASGAVTVFVAAVSDGARGAGGILVQFPLYFAILGLLRASELIQWFSAGLADLASTHTFPLLAFLSAGLVNLVVPSGGGQWAVQGEVLATAGQALHVAPATTVLAFAYGDAWTNMLQPFWALPLLGIMGLRARDIIGYTAVLFLCIGVFVPVLLLVMA